MFRPFFSFCRPPTRAPACIPACTAALLAALCGTPAQAEGPVQAGPDVDADVKPPTPKPLWELGVGVAGLRVPDYRGSDQNHGYVLPVPYFVYRGTWLKADRDGARALLFDTDRVKVDVSLAASTPTSSSDNRARQGMPDLPAVVEIGPNLNLTLAGSRAAHWKLDLRLPVRGAVTVQRSPEYIGMTFSPNLNLDLAGVAGGWDLGLLTGPLFADRKYQQHFYSVDAIYATPDRPAYQAHGGYGGWQALAATSRRFGNMWVGGFVRYDTLHGAAFDDSPLVRRQSAVSFGFGISWILKTSSELVNSGE
ncbi:MAG TPA: MipA/OmpV family protein [Burkholderiaceae bacterium]